MPASIAIGETVRIDSLELTRRGWLKCLATGGAGLVGLKSAIERASGASAEGVPLVLTRDEHGNPDRIRMVSQERYESLQRYQNLDVEMYFDRFDDLNGITVTTPGDRQRPYEAQSSLELKFYFDSSPGSASRSNVPNRVGQMPIHVEQRDIARRVRECREGQIDDPVGGGSYVYVDAGGGYAAQGTVGVAGYYGGQEAITTAGHVAKESFDIDDRIWQSGELVGSRLSYSLGNDIAAYRARYVDADAGHVVEPSIPDVTGTWDYAGLADASAGWGADGPDVEMAGAQTCNGSTTVYNTEMTAEVVHQINMDDNVSTGGDSGAPYVDSDGKLAALHIGTINRSLFSDYSFGSAGTESLASANVTLAP